MRPGRTSIEIVTPPDNPFQEQFENNLPERLKMPGMPSRLLRETGSRLLDQARSKDVVVVALGKRRRNSANEMAGFR